MTASIPTATPRHRSGAGDPPWPRDAVAPAAVAVVAAAVTATAAVGQAEGSPAWNAALVACESLPLLWRRRAPVVVLAATLMVSWLVAAVPVAAFTPMLAAVVAAYAVAVSRSWGVAATGGTVAAIASALVVRVLLDAPFPFHLSVVPVPDHPLDALAGSLLAFGGATTLGASVRARRAHTASIEERAVRLERERADRERRAVLEERARIARELHDVAAHHLSGLVLQAGALERTVERDPEQARALAADVRAGGATALASMRRLVGILRAADDEPSARGSRPSLSDLEGLVTQATADGLTVRLDADPDDARCRIPPETQLAAYRIVQESLTNARRHAPGARVDVTVACRAGTLAVEVADDGGHPDASDRLGAAPDRLGAADGSGTAHRFGAADPGAGDGQGLIGMRERATLLDGTFGAGPRHPRGWVVRAELPLDPEGAP